MFASINDLANALPDPTHKLHRVTINGKRHYTIPHPTTGRIVPLPSVTTILSGTQSPSAKARLIQWNIDNPGELEKAGTRGTWLHTAAEAYLEGHKVIPPKDYEPFWNGIPELLDNLLEQGAKILWSEKPFGPEFMAKWGKHTVTDTGLARIFNFDRQTGYGYAGAADLVYELNGQIYLADFKTSNCPYAVKMPKKEVLSPEQIENEIQRRLYGGVIKFRKCAAQLAAYSDAFDFTLGLRPDHYQIFVSTADVNENWNVQKFTLSPWQIEKAHRDWNECLDAYHNHDYVECFNPFGSKRSRKSELLAA